MVMKDAFKKGTKFYYKEKDICLLCGDSFKLISKIKDKKVDCIFADPPYFLSNGGISVSGGKQISVNKADWDKGLSVNEKHKYNRKWIKLCRRVLKDDGTIWISGTMHNIYSVGLALEQEGFKIINNITWEKSNPPPNLACRCFTHSTETILWAKKDCKKNKHLFNYKKMKEQNNNKQMKDVWTGSLTPKKEKSAGRHPTQKPKYILQKIIDASTNEGDLVLDLFNGSGTTGIVSLINQRKYIGIDNNSEYLDLTIKRIELERENDKKKF